MKVERVQLRQRKKRAGVECLDGREMPGTLTFHSLEDGLVRHLRQKTGAVATQTFRKKLL